MHIPTQIKDTDIQPFSKELVLSLDGKREYDSVKWLYVPCEYKEYRYILGTRAISNKLEL